MVLEITEEEIELLEYCVENEIAMLNFVKEEDSNAQEDILKMYIDMGEDLNVLLEKLNKFRKGDNTY